jgi:hypothetical protein
MSKSLALKVFSPDVAQRIGEPRSWLSTDDYLLVKTTTVAVNTTE